MELHKFRDAEALSEAVAKWIADVIAATLKRQPRFTIALSGGSTPERLHKILAAAPYKEQIDWSKLHIFWGDERAVPFQDSRNNAKMAFETLLNHVPVPAAHIHVMRTDISPEQSATEYEKILHQYFGEKGPSFDLVLLGMGDDGHTLSLFPGTAVVHEEKVWVTSFFLKAQDMHRITLTRPIVNRAARIAFLTTGPKKAHALKEVLKGEYHPDLYPSQTIMPQAGELHWFVDDAAAAELS
ncbi:6-phosphogluconolactonase [Flavitalea sp. BT771]|uniref:6-phosphogluconolactonase n=1 Tax=Flavitalea sp. BT771 TaxID=3063329 RepID=UPI0026E1B668|nr:6-phosphogluconolactonase [Flavitalea sp. BT771]MDO6434376.1 6-phosphogluconolactonase [Flavitalea sp. BT771]MDV6223276.1 6-phosphogluconolactonase [Flavitalea sp. BT771]